MNNITLYLVQLPESSAQVARQAARDNWPHIAIVNAKSVAEAAAAPGSGRQLLVLGSPDEAEHGAAAQTLDAGELPRWAVVALSPISSELVESVPPQEWTVPVVSRVLRFALLQHELLRENLQLRGDLKTIARRVSHDARTPLGCIHTICELLKDVPPDNAASLKESTDVIRNSTAEINLLIDRVSLLIRSTLDPQPPTVFPMALAVDHALQQLEPELAASAKKVRQPTQWPEVEGVPQWCEAIWWNLIRNALVHGSKTGNVQLGWTREGNAIRFSVSSPGVIPAPTRERLLRRFHLLHQQPSAGLGLSVVERLASLQDGRSGFEPGEENRSIFYFTVPAPASSLNAGTETPSLATSTSR